VTVSLPLVIGLALIAVQAGRQWIDRQVNERVHSLESGMPARQGTAPALGTLVVASQQLQFGSQLAPASLREIAWPAASVPHGAFAHVTDLFKNGAAPVALSPIDPGEPILEDKISGPGRQASLAALIRPGMKAITVRVDEVIGVAGFVAPGDRVDVLLTHRTGDAQPVSDVVQQDLKVLAVDQTVDNPTAKPTVARAVTLEADTEQAQKLALAESIGNLTLVLRPLGRGPVEHDGRITLSDLNSGTSAPSAANRTVTVSVIRNSERRDYSVPAHY
jgi:pilus assembly protein CpaB